MYRNVSDKQDSDKSVYLLTVAHRFCDNRFCDSRSRWRTLFLWTVHHRHCSRNRLPARQHRWTWPIRCGLPAVFRFRYPLHKFQTSPNRCVKYCKRCTCRRLRNKDRSVPLFRRPIVCSDRGKHAVRRPMSPAHRIHSGSADRHFYWNNTFHVSWSGHWSSRNRPVSSIVSEGFRGTGSG